MKLPFALLAGILVPAVVAAAAVTPREFTRLVIASNAESAKCQVFVENLRTIDPELSQTEASSFKPYTDQRVALEIWNQLALYPGTSKATNLVLAKAHEAQPQPGEHAAYGAQLTDIGYCRAFIAQNAILKIVASRKTLAFLKGKDQELVGRAARFLDLETRAPRSIGSIVERLELIQKLVTAGLIKDKKTQAKATKLLGVARRGRDRAEYWKQINPAPGPEFAFKALKIELEEAEKVRPGIRDLIRALSTN